MKPSRVLKRLGLAAATLLALALLAIFTLDLGFLRETIEARASQALSRSLTLDELSIRFGRTSRVEVRGLRLADIEGSNQPDLLNAERIFVEIDTLSLWRNTLPVIRSIEAGGIQVRVVQDENGGSNWQLGAATADDAEAAASLPFLLQQARITDVELDLESPRLSNPVHARIDTFGQQIDDEGVAQLSVQGQVQDDRFALTGAVGPWTRLLKGEDLRLQFEGQLGLGTLDLEGQFDHLWAPRQPLIDLSAHSPSLRHLMTTLGLGDWEEGAVSIELQTRPQADRLVISLQAKAGGLHAELSADTDNLSDPQDLAIQAQAEGPNLGGLLQLAGQPGWPEQPFQLAADLQRSGATLQIHRLELAVAETQLSAQGHIPALPSLSGAQLELAVAGPRLQDFSSAADIGELPEGPFRISGQVAAGDGKRTDVDLAFELAPGKGRIHGFLTGPEDYQLQLSLDGPDLAGLKRLQGLAGLPSGPFHVGGTVMGDPAENRFDLEFTLPPGQGHLSGSLQRDDRLSLKLNTAGSLASRLGTLFGIDGLPDSPWQLKLDIGQTSAGFYEIGDFAFETAGTQLSVSGQLGAESMGSGTSLKLALAGERMAPFQALAPPGLTLPDEAFSLSGTIASGGRAWLINPLELRVGSRRLNLQGQLGRGPDLAGTKLSFDLAGRDFHILTRLPGPGRLPEGQLSLGGQLAVEAGELRLETVRLEAGDLQASVEAALPWPLDGSHGRLRLDAHGGDITQILPELAGRPLQAAAFSLRAGGDWNEQQIRVEDSTLSVGEARLQASGLVDLPPNSSATDLSLQLHVPDLARLHAVDNAHWAGVPFDFETQLTGSPQAFELNGLQARLGDSTIRGLVRLNLDASVPEFDLNLSADTLDLRPFLPEEPQQAKPKPQKTDRLIPDTPLPFERLQMANGNFSLAVDLLLLKRSTFNNSLISGQLRDGVLQISKMGMDTTGGRLSASLGVTPVAGQGAEVKFGLHSKGLILNFTDLPLERKRQEPPLDIDTDLAASGSTIRELAASLNGSFIAHSPGGRVSNDGKFGDSIHLLAKVVTAISPQAALSDHVDIVCFAAAAQAHDGLVTLDPGVALQSSRLVTLANGNLDLSTEKLDLGFSSRTSHLADISASELITPYVRVGGTLAKPSIQLDKKGTLISGGAAVLSGGLSILAKKALDQLDQDPCGQILAKAGQNASQP